jgi:Bacterial Ig-like domain
VSTAFPELGSKSKKLNRIETSRAADRTYGLNNSGEHLEMSAARYKKPLETIVTVLAASAALSGCAGNGNGLDSNGNPVAPGGGGSTPLTADFQSIQDNVFTPRCTKCHIGAGAPQGLQLDAAHSYALLVGVASNEQPSLLRVQPNDPDSSYLIRKLEGGPGISGVQMPADGPPYLPQSTIDVIRQWITNGAQKPAAAAMSVEASIKAVQRFSVATTSPDNGSIVSMVVPQVIVAFNGDIDSNLLNNTTVSLSQVGTSQGAPDTALLVSTHVPAGNSSAIVITPQTPLGNGSYRVTLHAALANMNAQALGSDYSFTFTVDALQ